MICAYLSDLYDVLVMREQEAALQDYNHFDENS